MFSSLFCKPNLSQNFWITPNPHLEICLLSDDIMDYHIVSQGKTTIPSVDDAEELTFTDVRPVSFCLTAAEL